MKRTPVRLVLTTFPSTDRQKATDLARSLISEHLAACVWILPPMYSVYFWEGKLTEDTELLMVAKTDADHHTPLIQAISQAHPYTVPEIISISPESVNPEYESWLTEYLGSSDVS